MEYINKNRSCVFLALSSSTQFNKHIEEMQENRHFIWCGHGERRAWWYKGVTIKPMQYHSVVGKDHRLRSHVSHGRNPEN